MLKKNCICFFASLIFLTSCSRVSLDQRNETAQKIAAKAEMGQKVIKAKLFDLTTWGHVRNRYEPINIYIEGDGLAWMNKYKPSTNPTPVDPVALKLAALDGNDNVIYIARPCQYSGWNIDGYCSNLYWTSGRTAPEVIESFMAALDQIKEEYKDLGFNLVGYSGGAAVAVILASKRDDVKSVRTVAGNTAYEIMGAYHHISPMQASIDPISVAYEIRNIPQIHFVGGKDKVVPIDVFEKWSAVSENSPCVKSFTVGRAEHNRGWEDDWYKLQNMAPSCE